MYDRNQSHQMSSYMASHVPSEIPEEDEFDEVSISPHIILFYFYE